MAATRSARLSILCAVLAAACGEALTPRDIAGKYALQRVVGDSLPTVLLSNSVRVFADTLSFTSQGRGIRNTVVERAGSNGEPSGGLVRWESSFGFGITDGKIEVGFDCPPNANCVAPPHMILRRTSGGLEADYAFGERVPLTYTRVPSAR